ANFRPNGARVVVGLLEEPAAPAVAGKQERSGGALLVRVDVQLQQFVQVFVGSGGVADMKLNGLPGAHAIRDRKRAAVAVHADYVANQEIAALKAILVFVDHPTNMEATLKKLLIARS